MRKREFLNQLRKRLNEENCSDVEDIISYYDELIEDTIDRTGDREEIVVRDLGSIEDIVIRVNPSKKTKKEDRIYYDEVESNTANNKKVNTKKASNSKKSNDDLAIKVVIAIITAPIWLSLIIVLASLIFAVGVCCIAIAIVGIVCFIQGVIGIVASLGNALFQMGIGLILCGLATVGAPLIIKIISLLIKAIVNFVKFLFGAFNNGGRRVNYEN